MTQQQIEEAERRAQNEYYTALEQICFYKEALDDAWKNVEHAKLLLDNLRAER